MGVYERTLAIAVVLLSCAGALTASPGPAHAGDAMRGKAVFTDRCLRCHAYPSDFGVTAEDIAADAGSRAKEGTPLAGLIGRRAGSLPDYFYSDSMKAAKLIWDQETLRAFILSPRTYIKYNRMGFSGIQDEAAVDDLVTYLMEAAKQPAE